MKIVKIILRYLMYGLILFIMSGFMFSMIKNSDSSASSKKIFDSTRNFAPIPSASEEVKEQYVVKTKPYKKNLSDCMRIKEKFDVYLNESNKYNLETSSSACNMANNLDQALSFMVTLKVEACSEFDGIAFKTYSNLHKMSITKCRQ